MVLMECDGHRACVTTFSFVSINMPCASFSAANPFEETQSLKFGNVLLYLGGYVGWLLVCRSSG